MRARADWWVDGGFKKAFAAYCRAHHVGVEVVERIHPHKFVILPRRWVVERTWAWTWPTIAYLSTMNATRKSLKDLYGLPTAASCSADSAEHDTQRALGKLFRAQLTLSLVVWRVVWCGLVRARCSVSRARSPAVQG